MLKLLFREEPASSHSQQLYALLQLRKQKKQVFNLYLESLWAKGEVKKAAQVANILQLQPRMSAKVLYYRMGMQ